MAFEKPTDFTLSVNVDRNQEDKNHCFQENEQAGEGQLMVDVLETDTDLIVLATMAGTPPDAVELLLHNDLLTIKGRRDFPFIEGLHQYYKECYWGKYSRTIVLPVDIITDLVRAEYRHGLLTIILPKISKEKNIPIFVVEE